MPFGKDKDFYQFKKIKYISKGLATYLPDCVSQYLPKHQPQFSGKGIRKNPGEAATAHICYSAWMRSLVSLYERELVPELNTVAEIGPGDSLGVGLAALLSGANNYFAFDIVKTAYNYCNQDIFEELVLLFKKRAPILNDEEEPKMLPRLKSYEFPDYIFSDEKLEELLDDVRLDLIRRALARLASSQQAEVGGDGEIDIRYFVPWDESGIMESNSADMIFAAAAMEHVNDIDGAYAAAAAWLKRGGIFINCVDFKSHGTAGLWNGHWTYSDFTWKLIGGGSQYLINRQPHSAHISEMAKHFDIVSDITQHKTNLFDKSDLAGGFKILGDDDLTICGAYIVGKKK